MFLRYLVMFVHFDTHAFENARKAISCMILIYQLGFLTQNVEFIGSDEASYENVQHGSRTPKGYTFSL